MLSVAAAVGQPSVATNDRVATVERALASNKPVAVSDSAARQQLNAILSSAEFSETMRGPSAWEHLKRQIGELWMRHLDRFFKALADHPATTSIVFWGAALGALGLIVFVVLRLFRRNQMEDGTAPPIEITTAGSCGEWIQAARSASGRGELNKGIQCLYWAAVIWLQSAGTLPKAHGLTPRELLRAARAKREAAELNNLTSSLEQFWYGRMTAGTDDFAACVRSVEALGCRLD